jgi:hypothetical protein
MRYGFGSVVVVNNTEISSPSRSSSPHMERGARGVVAVVIGRDCAVNGGLRVYIPSKSVVVVRRYAKPGSLSSDIIALMNKRAEECRQTDLTDRVVRIGGQYVFPQPLIEDTVPPSMTPSLPEHSRGGHMPPRGAPQSTNVQSGCCRKAGWWRLGMRWILLSIDGGTPRGAVDFPGAFLFATLGTHRYMWLGKDSVTALLADYPDWKRFVKKNGTMMVKVEGALYGFAAQG